MRQHARGQRRSHIELAPVDALHGTNDLLSGATLQDVTVDAQLQHRGQITIAFGGGQYDEANGRILARNCRCRADSIVRQVEIEQHDIRQKPLSDVDGVNCGAAVSHDFDAGCPCKQFGDAFTKQRMVVNDGGTDRIGHDSSSL